MIDKFLELIFAIAKRPTMYGVSKVEDIYLVIFGFIYAIQKEKNEIAIDFMSGFRKFVNEELDDDFSSNKDFDWPRLIRFYASGDNIP
ncbi:MAG: hypothetical protein JO080_05310 [Mucilaginibacter sp.]|nr:hypothetical protein [Mucilaginibacter sp.]